MEPAMTDTDKAIKKVYDEGMSTVYQVVGSLTATPKQRQVARQTAADLTSLLVTHTLKSIEGRTALLAGLIVELNQVIDAIQAKPPSQAVLTNLTGVLNNATSLYTAEKKAMV
jgi:hypothetical protein